MNNKEALYKNLNREISAILKHLSKIQGAVLSGHKISGSGLTYVDFLTNSYLVMSVIKQGIPYSLFDIIRKFSPFTEEDWADYLNISTKTLQRFEAEEKDLKPILSEKVIELSEVILAGMDTFGSLERFKSWLDTPNYALGNIKPFQLLKDSYGKELLMGELLSINYGILG